MYYNYVPIIRAANNMWIITFNINVYVYTLYVCTVYLSCIYKYAHTHMKNDIYIKEKCVVY